MYLKWVSCRQHVCGSCFCIYSARLLVGAFSLFTFKVVIDICVLIAILLIVLDLFCRSFFPFILLFSCDLMAFLGYISGLLWCLRCWRVCLQYGRPGFDPWVGKIPWRRKWQPSPVFLPGKSHGQRNLAGYSQWGHRVGHDWVTNTSILSYFGLSLDSLFLFMCVIYYRFWFAVTVRFWYSALCIYI